VDALDGYFRELEPLHAALLRDVGELPSAGALMQAPLLYVVARSTRPRWAIETGISSGYSARLLLEAFRKNRAGHLDSIGVDEFALNPAAAAARGGLADRHVGWLVPPDLYPFWTLRIGRSDDLLPPLLASSPAPVGLFLHDSLHQYATMRWEYASAFPRLAPGGLLASHDIHANAAWPEFIGTHPVERVAEVDHDLGLAALPRAPVASGTSPRPASG